MRIARLLALVAAAGCGPVGATSVIDDADAALGRAHAAEGEKYALYETTLADLYLAKAKEAQGHSRYSEAQKLGADALKYAETATRKAAERRTAPPAAPQATVQHPADPTTPAPVPPPPPVPAEKKPAPAEKKKPIDPGEQH